jgi:hypothetical protein
MLTSKKERTMLNKIKKISNPLTVIAIFAGIAEVSGSSVLPFLESSNQTVFIFFVMGFPTLLICLFFATLNWNHKVLYAPTDFREDKSFLETIRKQTPQEISDSLERKSKESINIGEDITVIKRRAEIPINKDEEKKKEHSITFLSRPSFLPKFISLLAEDLALRKMEQEFHVSINRDIRFGQDSTVMLDGIAQKDGTIIAFEVKYFRTPLLAQKMMANFIFQGGRFVEEAEKVHKDARFILIAVVDFEGNQLPEFEDRLRNAIKLNKYEGHIEYRLLDFNNLKREFGLSEESSM